MLYPYTPFTESDIDPGGDFNISLSRNANGKIQFNLPDELLERTCVHVHVCGCGWMYMHMYISVCVCKYMCKCMHTCIHIVSNMCTVYSAHEPI